MRIYLQNFTAPGQDSILIMKSMYGINVMFFFFGLARFYAINEYLGPKLDMLGQMSLDFWTFAAFWFLVILGFGIASQNLLFPFDSVDRTTIANIFWRPFFMLFQGMHVDTSGPFSTGYNSQCGFGALDLLDAFQCQAPNWILTVLVGFYLVISNIILLNMLIAMLTSTHGIIVLFCSNKPNFPFFITIFPRR